VERIGRLAVRVGFERSRRLEDVQVTDSSLPEVPSLPGLPSRIAHHCPRPPWLNTAE
jgi:hypothetical protein